MTKAQDIQQLMSDDIVHGRLVPGSTLDETVLAHQFGVSRTPVREAIRQLATAGLVETKPHRGAVVATISPDMLDDMFAVMAELEALCARWSALVMSAVERRDLRVLHAGSAVLVREDRRAAYVAANDAFHNAVYDGTRNMFLAETTRQVRLRLAPFRRVQFEGPARLARSFAEHERIVAAIERGDTSAAEAEMRAHMMVVRRAVDAVTTVADATGGRRAKPVKG